MRVIPLTSSCEKAYSNRRHICFGISPFNSYFSEEKLYELASWGKKEFASIHFFVPDIPSVYTLQALGYPPEKAQWKARRQSQYLINKIKRALGNLGLRGPDTDEMILVWDKLISNETYLQSYRTVKNQYSEDSEFQKKCLEATRWIFEKKVEDINDLSQDSLLLAVEYLLAEIPLFVDSGGIANVESSVFCYHQSVAFLEELFQGLLPIRPSPNQGFILFEGTSSFQR